MTCPHARYQGAKPGADRSREGIIGGHLFAVAIKGHVLLPELAIAGQLVFTRQVPHQARPSIFGPADGVRRAGARRGSCGVRIAAAQG